MCIRDRTRGALVFDQERMPELHLYDAADPAGRRGFRRLLVEPGHGDYGRFCIGAGHGFGYNDMIVVEMAELIAGITDRRPVWPDFAAGARTAAVIDAVLASIKRRCWVRVDDITGTER